MTAGTEISAVIRFCVSRDACGEGIRWLRKQSTPDQSWRLCERPDWMIWYAARRGVDRMIIAKIACDCARTALRFVPEGDARPLLCIEATERWIVGEATIEEVRIARRAAYTDAATYADAAAYAAAAAAYAYAAAAAAVAAYAWRLVGPEFVRMIRAMLAVKE